MHPRNEAKKNRINRRVKHIISLIDKHGALSVGLLHNYLSDCMESDIRREKKANKELLSIINSGKCIFKDVPLKRKEK